MKLNEDHQFVKNVSARSVLWNLTKGGKTVTIKQIQAALKEAGLQYKNDYLASKQFKNRVYWFDVEVQELGFETEQSIDDDKQLTAIRLVKKEKASKKAKKEKPLAKSAKKKPAKKRSKKAESESVEPEESESESESSDNADESEE